MSTGSIKKPPPPSPPQREGRIYWDKRSVSRLVRRPYLRSLYDRFKTSNLKNSTLMEMTLIKSEGAIMSVLCKQLLPKEAEQDAKFAQFFKTKSMNECSNRMMSALLILAQKEGDKSKGVCVDYGAEDLIPIARAFYEKDATADQMAKMLKDMIAEKEKIQVQEAEKKKADGKKKDTTPAPPTAPSKATLPPPSAPAPTTPAPTPAPSSLPPRAKQVQIVEDDDDFELD